MPDAHSIPRDLADRLAAWERNPADRTDTSALELFARFAKTVAASAAMPQDTIIDVIRAAIAAGHEEAAIAALRAWVSREGSNKTPQLLLCATLLRRGDPEAGRMLAGCLHGDPTPSSGWVDVGDALLENGKREAALVCFAKAPPSRDLSLRSGLLARDLGRRAEALSWFQQAVHLDPKWERSWFLLGACAQDGCDFGLAAEAYRTVLDLNPDRVEAEVNLGMCLQAMGRLEDARQSYTRAVRARPDTFGRIAQALPGSSTGELWLDLGALRRSLAG